MTCVLHLMCISKRNGKIVGVVNHILDWRGAQFYDLNEQTLTRQFLWQKSGKFIQSSQSYDTVCQLALFGFKGLSFTEEGKGSKVTKFTANSEKNTKSVSSQAVAHNLQNVPNEMTRTICRFSNRNFRFSVVNGKHPTLGSTCLHRTLMKWIGFGKFVCILWKRIMWLRP